MMEDTKITDEQAAAIAKDLDDFVKGTDVEMIQNLPSNNGVETATQTEEGEYRKVNVNVDPATGEHKILSTEAIEEDTRSVDQKIEEVSGSIGLDLDSIPATAEEFAKAMQSDNVLKEIAKDSEFDPEDIKVILDITNRKIGKEKFNVYRAFPEAIRKMIDDYVMQEMGSSFSMGANIAQINMIKNNVAESIIDQFASDIQFERARHDFAQELSNIYRDSTLDIVESSIEYFDERNKAYRDAAEKMEDEEKKSRMLNILDRIDQARTLDELKEFAKKCKIKPIELEKPKTRVFDEFTAKYKDSANNIYDINMCAYVLARNLPEKTDAEIFAFLIVFCKYIKNWDISDPLSHAFIYYVLYYCAMLDGDKSDKFKNNVREVIDLIKTRNSSIDFGEIDEETLKDRLYALDKIKERREAAKKADAERAALEKDSITQEEYDDFDENQDEEEILED